MSSGTREQAATGRRSTEERAEELMTRVTADASRILTKALGRAREELEDILAEGRARYEQGMTKSD